MRRFLLQLMLVVLLLPAPVLAAPKLLVLGDSLSAAYGIPLESGWVSRMQERIRSGGWPHDVINASISGETTAGGLNRLPELLERHEPVLVLIQLGGNDGLRGQPVARMIDNLTRMVETSREHGAEAVLFEMMIPTNYGPAYTRAFTAAFSEVGEALQVPVVPFLLADIAEEADHFLDDGIHPSEDAQPMLLDTVWPHIEPLLDASADGDTRN